MTPTDRRPWPARSRLGRLVPSVVVVGLVAAAAAAGTAKGREEPTQVMKGPSFEEMAAYGDNPDLPVTYEGARQAGTLADHDWGDRCDTTRRYNDTDRTLARLAIPSTYAPPCVPVWDGDRPWVSAGGRTFADNGGSSAPGVTAETIKVVFYLPAEQDITKQAEQFGVLDGAAATLDGVRRLVEMSNQLYETYGRRVELVPFHASGDGRSPSAARADAVRVVEMGAFASIGGPNQTGAYQHELARNGVLCIQCGYASTDPVLGIDAPYAWSYSTTPDQLVLSFGDLLTGGGQGPAANKAWFAGDPELRGQTRRVGVVHYEQDPPIFGPLREEALSASSSVGIEPETVIQYILDPNTINQQAQAIIGRLKRDGVTTVLFLGDPLMPRLLTQQATKQDYFPEWVFTGTVFTDTSVVGRLYDQRQMAHAVSASLMPSRTAPEVSEGWKLYEWWYGEPPTATKTMVVWGPVVQMLFLGIHMAGPNLTAETFAGGLFNYPPTGNTAVPLDDPVSLVTEGYLAGDTTPAIGFGPKENGSVDFSAIDDITLVWWSAEDEGPDESGQVGRGLWMYAGFGLRLPLDNLVLPTIVGEEILFKRTLSEVGGQLWELAQSFGVGDLEIAGAVLDETPPLNELPEYPRWPESPAAQGAQEP